MTTTNAQITAITIAALTAACIPLLVHHWIAHRRHLAISRARWAEPQQSTPPTVAIWKQRAVLAEQTIAAYQRETFLAVRRSEELARQLEAARRLGRHQEANWLAVNTLAIEIERDTTWQIPAVRSRHGTVAS